MPVRRHSRRRSGAGREVVADPCGIWSIPLSHPERLTLTNAFAYGPELRRDAEALLRHLRHDLRDAFVATLARTLLGPPVPVAPVAALLPALSATISAAVEGNESA